MRSTRKFFLAAFSLIFVGTVGNAPAETQTAHATMPAILTERRATHPQAPKVAPVARTSSGHMKPIAHLGSPGANESLLVAPQISTGGIPVSIVSGDFNGDGKKDLAVITTDSSGGNPTLAVLLGQGDGSFQQSFSTAIQLDSVTRLYVGSLNKDANDDVVVVNDGSVSLFLGSSDGTLSGPTNYVDGIVDPEAVMLSDLNGDGNVDLIIADGISGRVSTLTGNGDGTFNAAVQTQVAGQKFSAALFADVDGDGKLDLVTNTEVFMSDGAGGFQPGVPLSGNAIWSCQWSQRTIAIADLNQDGHPDLVTTDCANDTVTIFLGQGGGVFSQGTSVWAGFDPQSVRLVDVNGDGKLDIVVANVYPGDVTVLLGDGSGSFQPATTGYSLGASLSGPFVMADFNGDGVLDLIAPQNDGNFTYGLTYLQGHSDGTFAAATDCYEPAQVAQYGDYSVGMASGDFNGDGKPDVVVGGFSNGTAAGVTVFLGGANGTFQPGVNYGSGGALNYTAVADFNGDGKLDFVASDFNTGNVNLFLGNGDGTFQSPVTFAGAPGGSAGIVTGDFNHDGHPDVAVVGFPTGVYVLLNDGSGGFLAASAYTLSDNGWEMAAADINGDGNLDLLVPHPDSGTLSIFAGKADGTFQAESVLSIGANPIAVAAGDVNGDGKMDLVLTTDAGIAVALGNGDGTFQPITFNSCCGGGLPGQVALADLNHDGKLDVVYAAHDIGMVGVMTGNGDGSFNAAAEFPAGGTPYGIVVADVNGDGALDVMSGGGYNFAGMTVLLNSAVTSLALTSSPNPSSYGQPVTLTATVGGSARVAPTGTVTFTDGGTVVGSGSVDGNGDATLVLPALTAGTHVFQASYSGDTNFLASTSSTLTQTVTGATPDYTLAATPASATIQPGGQAVFSIQATPSGGFTGTVNFSCGTLPEGVTCEFVPSSVSLASGPATVQLTVSAAADVMASAAPAPATVPGLPFWTNLSTGLFGFVLVSGLDSKKRFRSIFCILLLVLLAMLSMTGCGGSTQSPVSNTGVVAHSHTVQVKTSSQAGSGGNAGHQLNLVLTIQQ
ncbi:MAG TPA: FG-GAP-like repeat-containing protein [Terriglobales bacterium]|nr:FG-GAP-like repeat-containing protein [Terriglobales bacterium]